MNDADPAPSVSDDAKPELDPSCLQHLLGYQLAQANVPIRRIFLKNIGASFQLGPVEFTVLSLVANNRDVTQKQLSRTLSVSAPNITALLDRLEQRGLLTRLRSQSDRRSQVIRLTGTGAALARKALEVSQTMEHEALSPLSRGERGILIELLQKVARHGRP